MPSVSLKRPLRAPSGRWRGGECGRPFTHTEDALNALTPLVEAQFAAVNAGDFSGALARTPDVERAVAAYHARLNDSNRAVQDQLQLGRAEVNLIAEETRNSILIVLMATAGAGILFAFMIHRSITKPLDEFMRVVEKGRPRGL